MCLIIDANCAGTFFRHDPDPVPAMVWDWLDKGGRIVYGGYLYTELLRVSAARRLLAQLDRAGKARQFPRNLVEAKTQELVKLGTCRSNDPHVVALASVSGARTLYSEDTLLMTDFTNSTVLQPKGRVFNRREHAHLLTHAPGCPAYRASRSQARRQPRKR